jgi:hypothetical protein
MTAVLRAAAIFFIFMLCLQAHAAEGCYKIHSILAGDVGITGALAHENT